MDVTVTARHTSVSDRFRRHLEEKVEKVEQLSDGCYRVDAVLSEEKNPRQTSLSHRIELTVHSRGPVVRGEACSADPYAALDLALDKLYERLRRARDRRKVHHGRHAPESLTHASARWEGMDLGSPRPPAVPVDGAGPAAAGAGPTGADASADGAAEDEGAPDALDGSPVEIREKVHPAVPMTVEQALYEMELVGHDFYLFVDAATGAPSAMYRRKGWSYGVIRLSDQAAPGDVVGGSTSSAGGGFDGAAADGGAPDHAAAPAAGGAGRAGAAPDGGQQVRAMVGAPQG